MGDMSWGGNDRGPTILGVTWSLTAVSSACVALRIISRTAFGRNRLGLDDYITLFCVAWMLVAGIVTTLAVEVGLGKHITDIDPPMRPLAVYFMIIVNTVVLWCFSLPKFAIIALLHRLLRLPKWQLILFWGVALINQGGVITSDVLWWVRCHPVEANWDPTKGTCGSFTPMAILGWIISIISPVLDLFFALFPIPFVARLNMTARKRVAICLALGMGSLACAISIYKVTTIPLVAEELAMDPTYNSISLIIFADVEANILIITASLPTIGPVIRALSGKTGTPSYDSSHNTNDKRHIPLEKRQRPLPIDDGFDRINSANGTHKHGVPTVTTADYNKAFFRPESRGTLATDGGIRVKKSVDISVSQK